MITPSYAELPREPRSGSRCAWGVFGPDDQIGTLNRLDPQRTLRAAREITSGRVFSLNWETTQPDPPTLGRRRLRHTVVNLAPLVHPGTDDRYDDFSPQGSSQWDSLSHIAHPDAGYYNGASLPDVLTRGRNGIAHAARHGIAGRFVLADVDAYLAAQGRRLVHTVRTDIGVDVLEKTLRHQGSPLEYGDILLLRFGWVAWYRSASAQQRAVIGHGGYFPFPGLAAHESTAEWLWDQGIAAVAADNPALEAMPADVSTEAGFLHYRLIPLLGMTVGEILDLDELAADCARDGRFSGLLTAAPLNTPGGSGSPANALAIK